MWDENQKLGSQLQGLLWPCRPSAELTLPGSSSKRMRTPDRFGCPVFDSQRSPSVSASRPRGRAALDCAHGGATALIGSALYRGSTEME